MSEERRRRDSRSREGGEDRDDRRSVEGEERQPSEPGDDAMPEALLAHQEKQRSQQATGEPSDEVLMVRVTQGDRESCDRLYERHASRLRSFIHRFVGHRDVAEDLLQDVFLKIYRNPGAFDPRGRFITWVLAVARNACIDWLRVKRVPTVPIAARDEDEDRRSDPPAIGPKPSDPAVLDELEQRLERVVRDLSPKLREVFLICALQGLSYEEAAEIIGCPVKTVSSRLSRARDQVFDAFHQDLGEGVRRHR